MLISIITPTYNDFGYLSKNLESFEKQSYKNFEHIIVDGASTDGTVDLLKSTDNIKYISEPDNGMYDAVNKGIKISKGEIISYLNADDRYFPETLELVANCFKQNPDIDFLYGTCQYIDESHKPIANFYSLPFMPKILLAGPIRWAQPACFWRKKVHEKIGLFDNNLKYVGDADFFMRMLSSGLKGKRLKQTLVKFMIRLDCISLEGGNKYKNEKLTFFNKYSISNMKLMNIVNKAIFYLFNMYPYYLFIKFYIPHKYGTYLNFMNSKIRKINNRG